MPNDDAPDPHPVASAGTFPPPPVEPDPKVLLDHIAEVSRNASATWFGLLGLLAFVGITLLGHRDADFFARGAGTQLPLVNVTVPVEAFFLAAPALVAAVYAYFHLYLMTLWEALAEAPPRIDGQPLSDRVHPWLVSYAALWYRDRRRRDGSSAPRPLGRTVVAVALLFGWLFGLVVLAGLWWRSMPAHDEWLTLCSGACLCFATLIGLTGFATAAKRMAGAPATETATNSGVRLPSASALVGLTAFFSWETTEGGFLPYDESGMPPLIVSADLREAELTPRPPDWKPFELWLRDLRRERGTRDPEQEPLIPTGEEIERYRLMIAEIGAPNLRDRDLRNADLAYSFLPGADLRQAWLEGANLERSQMQGANLRGARMQRADLRDAAAQGAHLGGAQMQGADLGARDYLDVRGAEMQGADLQGAQLQYANLLGAQMQGANLSKAGMQNAHLVLAQMEGANLAWAQMRGVRFGGPLDGAQMRGAVLVGANMEYSNCFSANLFAASVHAANLFTCGGIIERQGEMVGDDNTMLPPKSDLDVVSCLERDVLDEDVILAIEVAVSHLPDMFLLDSDPGAGRHLASREYFSKELYCDPGEVPRKVGRHPEPAAAK